MVRACIRCTNGACSVSGTEVGDIDRMGLWTREDSQQVNVTPTRKRRHNSEIRRQKIRVNYDTKS